MVFGMGSGVGTGGGPGAKKSSGPWGVWVGFLKGIKLRSNRVAPAPARAPTVRRRTAWDPPDGLNPDVIGLVLKAMDQIPRATPEDVHDISAHLNMVGVDLKFVATASPVTPASLDMLNLALTSRFMHDSVQPILDQRSPMHTREINLAIMEAQDACNILGTAVAGVVSARLRAQRSTDARLTLWVHDQWGDGEVQIFSARLPQGPADDTVECATVFGKRTIVASDLGRVYVTIVDMAVQAMNGAIKIIRDCPGVTPGLVAQQLLLPPLSTADADRITDQLASLGPNMEKVVFKFQAGKSNSKRTRLSFELHYSPCDFMFRLVPASNARA